MAHKYRKGLYCTIPIFLLLFFVSCQKHDITPTFTADTDTQTTSMQFVDTSHENSKVVIAYPELFNDRKNFDGFNQAIKHYVSTCAEEVYPEDYSNLTLNLKYEIKLLSDEMISIVFSGLGYVQKAAHPNHLFLAFNYSLAEEKTVKMSDYYTGIDLSFAALFRKCMEEQFDSNRLPVFESIYKEDALIVDVLKKIDDRKGDYGFYFAEDGLGLCVPTIYAGGDYAVAEIPYQEIQAYMLH